MKITEKLLCFEEWQRFLAYKIAGGHLSKAEEKRLSEYIENQEYLPAAKALNNGGFFSLPEAVQVNKSSSNKKRTVFVFPEAENMVQKFLAFQLLEYDYLFSDNLYSFRKDMGVKKAVTRLLFTKGIQAMYSFKLDISDYFNSVPAEQMLPVLKASLTDDDAFYRIVEAMLQNPYALIDGERQTVKKGILAGSPLSGFLSSFCALRKARSMTFCSTAMLTPGVLAARLCMASALTSRNPFFATAASIYWILSISLGRST